MSEQSEKVGYDLGTLDGIRTSFEARQRTSGKGFHALGDEVLQVYLNATGRLPKPVSAMTFRNFLQGKTTLRDPTGLELYFRALGANDGEMRTIAATLQSELDRRLAHSRTHAAQRALDGLSLSSMPYSRALLECEVVTWLEDSVAAPITHLTPRQYLFGPDGTEEPSADPERWGLLHHLDELTRIMARLDQSASAGLEAIPEQARARRIAQAAADLRWSATVYAEWLVLRPRAADLFFSRRRFMLHGFFPETERKLAIARAKRVGRIVMGFTERLAQESLIQGKRDQALLRTPRAENALEIAAERVLGIINSFYMNVVQGSQGTGAAFQAGYQLRHENLDEPGGMTSVHRQLLDSYEAAVRSANHKLEQDVRVPYGELHQIYSDHLERSRPLFMEIWERDYAGGLVHDALTLLVGTLHRFEVLDDKRYLALSKELFMGREAHAVLGARHPHQGLKL